jgi:nucleoside 2-deoxyribosyltransferase
MLEAVTESPDPDICRAHWELDLMEIRQADALLVYAEHKDRPNGTLFEIGYAIGHDTPVALVGNFEWGTWRHLPLIEHYASLRLAVEAISGVKHDSA